MEACMALTSADRSIAAVPLGHVTGVVANIMTHGALRRRIDHRGRVQGGRLSQAIAARERATQTVMVPAMYNLCLLQADFDSHDLSSVANRRLRRRTDAGRDYRKAGARRSRAEAG